MMKIVKNKIKKNRKKMSKTKINLISQREEEIRNRKRRRVSLLKLYFTQS